MDKYFKQLKEEVKFFPKHVDDFLKNSECDVTDLWFCLHNLDEEIKMLRKLMRKIKKETKEIE